jgi:23S rRNA (cytosine1962-C5)-methyltransferase
MTALGIIVAPPTPGFTLLDSGEGQKLEAWGGAAGVRLVRPEPQAMWRRRDPALWDTADARFEGTDEEEGPGRWSRRLPDFTIPVGSVRTICRLGNNHHVGLFPEQAPHWDEARAALAGLDAPEVLNLFGYTGAASLLLAAAGARVTHVDASKKAVAWARENQAASGLEDAPIRWIVDDALKFTAREVRRGRTYQGILLDPPKFGRGPKGETWDLFTDLAALLADVALLLAPDARFVILTAYALRASTLAFARTLEEALGRGPVAAGELALADPAGRLLPTSMFATWRP